MGALAIVAQDFLAEPEQAGFSRPDETRRLCRGVKRYLRALGHACLDEVPLASGRRADVVTLGSGGEIWIVEVKSCLDDLRADHKWLAYRLHCDRLYFATGPHTPAEAFPDDTGLIVADAFGASLVREAPEHRLPPATRKAMTVRFARAAAARLHALADPLAAPE